MEEKNYSIGELAEMTGLTVRTLQHYDNVGLLPAPGRTKNGHRYYQAKDLVRLEQIMLYRILGFSLSDISDKLTDISDNHTLREILVAQEFRLLEKIEALHSAFSAIDATLAVMDEGKEISPHFLLHFLNILPGDDIWANAPQTLNEDEKAAFSPYFPDFESVQSFYRRWKEILITAGALESAGIPTGSNAAQVIAAGWYSLMEKLTGIDADKLIQLQKNDSLNGLFRNKNDLEAANRYVAEALEIYVDRMEDSHD